MSEREDDFLGRWSRRKVEARGGLKKRTEAPETPEAPVYKPGRMRTDPIPPKEAPATATAVLDEAAENATLVQEATLREEVDDAPVPATADDDKDADETNAPDAQSDDQEDLSKIDFDNLNYDSDYKRFMKSGVPESVRKRALRMLWGSNPILANIDGLNDYDDDFTDAALAVKGLLKTSYKAGSGYLTPEEIEASYSEEARLAGKEPEEEDAGDSKDVLDDDAEGEAAPVEVAEADATETHASAEAPSDSEADGEIDDAESGEQDSDKSNETA